MTRIHLPGVLAMAVIVTASNILVQFLLGDFLTWGALTYPLAFLVTEVMNRVYGTRAARQVVLAGFAVGVVCSITASQLPGELITLRIAIGSGLAFLAAQLTDILVFNRLREDRHGGPWWRAPLAASVIGSAVDTGLFFAIAFSAAFVWLEPGNDTSWANEAVPLLGLGAPAPLWISMALADAAVKLALAVLTLAPFRAIVRKLSQPLA